VGAAIRLPRDDSHFGDRRLGIREEQLRAMSDDAAMLLIDTGQETRYVDERDQRDVEGIARPDESCGLDGRVDVERSGQHGRLLRDDADTSTGETGAPDHDVL